MNKPSPILPEFILRQSRRLPWPLRRLGRAVLAHLPTRRDDYAQSLAAENQAWGEHLQAEAQQVWAAWLDHPMICDHYQERGSIGGKRWEEWVIQYLGGPANKSLELGGAGFRSLLLWQWGTSAFVESVDVSRARIAQGEARRQELGAPGRFWVDDVNQLVLTPNTYDLIFACHSFHHFLKLEHVMEQVSQALTTRGLFVLEEYVGPTQFQWTDQQMKRANDLLRTLPNSLRTGRDGKVKVAELRPRRQDVVAASPFESIRSAEIRGLFERTFETVEIRDLGGTLQHLLYNGIIHNFQLEDPQAAEAIRRIYGEEDRLIDSGILPSDFMLLIGKRRAA